MRLTGQSVALRRMLSQPLLTAFAGITAVADKLMYFTDANTAGLFDLTAAGRALLDDPSASAQLDTLGVSAFMKTILDDANGPAAFATMGAAGGASYIKLPNNVIIQWGGNVVLTNTNGLTNFAFPITFGDTNWIGVAGNGDHTAQPTMIVNKNRSSLAANRFDIQCLNGSTGVGIPSTNVRLQWFAAGIA